MSSATPLNFDRKSLSSRKNYKKPEPAILPRKSEPPESPRPELKTMRRIVIDPEFDIATRKWFVEIEEQEFEAPTIRELLRKLPRRYKVRNYYPNGYDGRA